MFIAGSEAEVLSWVSAIKSAIDAAAGDEASVRVGAGAVLATHPPPPPSAMEPAEENTQPRSRENMHWCWGTCPPFRFFGEGAQRGTLCDDVQWASRSEPIDERGRSFFCHYQRCIN